MKTNYKPEIDGLRAIAIIFVTLYYAKFIFFQNLYFSDATTIKKIKAITIGDIVDAVLKATNKSPEVIWDETKPTTIPFRMASTERICSELGFKAEYTFEEGIKETVEWYKNNK